MRALVTGAGGFLGTALVRALAARGDAVRALVRTSPGPGTFPPGVEVVCGDALDPGAVRPAVRGCDVLFHLAGVRRAAERDEFFRANAGSTRIALEACEAEAPGLRRFVLAGSLAASGPSREGRREDDPPRPVEAYGESKAEAERIAFTFADRIPIAVARPPRIVGAGDRENLLFFRIVRAGFLLAIGGPPRPLSWIDVDDCARGLLALADHPAAAGQAFFLASEERTSAEGLQEAAAHALGLSPRRIPVPPWALRLASALADGVTRATGRRLPLSRKLAAQILAPGWVCETGKAREKLAFVAATPLARSMDRAARWYREHGWI
jgi:nucleoside-diphosphate-sugar epimerase